MILLAAPSHRRDRGVQLVGDVARVDPDLDAVRGVTSAQVEEVVAGVSRGVLRIHEVRRDVLPLNAQTESRSERRPEECTGVGHPPRRGIHRITVHRNAAVLVGHELMSGVGAGKLNIEPRGRRERECVFDAHVSGLAGVAVLRRAVGKAHGDDLIRAVHPVQAHIRHQSAVQECCPSTEFIAVERRRPERWHPYTAVELADLRRHETLAVVRVESARITGIEGHSQARAQPHEAIVIVGRTRVGRRWQIVAIAVQNIVEAEGANDADSYDRLDLELRISGAAGEVDFVISQHRIAPDVVDVSSRLPVSVDVDIMRYIRIGTSLDRHARNDAGLLPPEICLMLQVHAEAAESHAVHFAPSSRRIAEIIPDSIVGKLIRTVPSPEDGDITALAAVHPHMPQPAREAMRLHFAIGERLQAPAILAVKGKAVEVAAGVRVEEIS